MPLVWLKMHAIPIYSVCRLFHSYSLLPPSIILDSSPDKLSPLQLVATPDYPVAAGQEVHLHCSAFNMPIVTWSWQHLENQTWLEVGIGTDLTLTKPEQSGLYHCSAETKSLQKSVSPNHTVYIVSMPAATGLWSVLICCISELNEGEIFRSAHSPNVHFFHADDWQSHWN